MATRRDSRCYDKVKIALKTSHFELVLDEKLESSSSQIARSYHSKHLRLNVLLSLYGEDSIQASIRMKLSEKPYHWRESQDKTDSIHFQQSRFSGSLGAFKWLMICNGSSLSCKSSSSESDLYFQIERTSPTFLSEPLTYAPKVW